jgi:hypothetical protein
MTTKDQAITWIPTGPWPKEAEMLESWVAPGPTPDCRTCVNYYTYVRGPDCSSNFCTNGDQYIEAPKVVLWRTE